MHYPKAAPIHRPTLTAARLLCQGPLPAPAVAGRDCPEGPRLHPDGHAEPQELRWLQDRLDEGSAALIALPHSAPQGYTHQLELENESLYLVALASP